MKRALPAVALLLVVAFLVKRYLVHPSATRILERTVELYAGLESYADTTALRSDLAGLQGGYEFAYARPNRLRVRFRRLLDDQLLVSDGTTLYVYRPTTGRYRAVPAPRRLPDELPGEQPMLKLSLLNGTVPLDRLGKVRYQGRQKLHGTWTHRVRVTPEREEAEEGGPQRGVRISPAPRRRSETAPSPPEERAGAASEAPLAPGAFSEMVLWIGCRDALIYRTDVTFELGSNTVRHSLVCENISTAPPPAGTFTFTPPPDARPVAHFEPPQVVPEGGPEGWGQTEQDEGR
jgi:outer membrane lipoprotein-sorting protein